jgi:PDZ domain-containing protein
MTITSAADITAETTSNVDTTDDIVPGGDRSGRRRWPIAVGAIVAGVVVATFLSLTIRIPYDSIGPGSARDVNSIVSVQDHPVYPPKGKVLYTTVSVRERISLLEAFVGWLDPNVRLVSEREVRGSIPPDQYKQLNVEAMTDSKTAAEVVALRELGYTDLGGGAEVAGIEPGSPAFQVLKLEDVIIAVDDKPVATSADAAGAIRAHQPGDTIVLRVEREGGAPYDASAQLARGENGQALLGVRLATKVKLPFPIEIDSGSVEGPSAGLPYALELLDYLTPGELTGGASIAATGALAPDGRVGEVGGVAQKAAALRGTDINVFLVPKANVAEARAHAGGDLEIRPVETFEEALAALNSMPGSNALALGTPGGGPA